MRIIRSALQVVHALVRQESLIFITVLVVILSLWGFVEVAERVGEGETQFIDEWVLRALRHPDHPALPIGPAWLARAAADVSALGGTTVLSLMVTAVVGYLLLQRAYGAVWLVLAATLGGGLLNAALKLLFGRPRPEVVPHMQEVFSASFPSGHSLLSAIVYLTLGALLARMSRQHVIKLYFIMVALLMTGLIGLSRVYLGVHYPSDVLAGWSAGLVWALLCWLVARVLQRRGAVEAPPAEAKPSRPAGEERRERAGREGLERRKSLLTRQ